jgi:hypothetical protein
MIQSGPIGGASIYGGGPYADVFKSFGYINPFGRTWFVNGGLTALGNTIGNDGQTGTSPGSAFATIQQAMLAAASGASLGGDTIVLAPGTYTFNLASGPLKPLPNMAFVAAQLGINKPNVIIVSSGIANCALINVPGCTFVGIEFQAGDTTAANLISLATTAAVIGTSFIGCRFNGQSHATSNGILAGGASFACTSLNVVDCVFLNLTGSGIVVGVLGFADSYIGNNRFRIDTTATNGIQLGDTGSFTVGKGFLIENNVFYGFSSAGTAVGILIVAAGGDNTSALGCIRNNSFPAGAVATSITASKGTESAIENFAAVTGGALITA